MSGQFIGEIRIFGFTFAPPGWAFCDGSILQIAQNQALFSLLGTTYGGNGVTNFGLPDLRSRVPIHAGQGAGLSNFLIGQFGGSEAVTLTINQLPLHTHAISIGSLAATAKAYSGSGNAQSPVGNVPAKEAAGVTATYSNVQPDSSMGAGAISLTGTPTAAASGNGVAFDNHSPYLTFNFCIALVGIFPSRN